ncbi:Peptide methionine sulfoxide reductase MsrA [Legionella pneumophila subsp. pneumophila LPE509]|nr:Peptide methionine sulfoxide reductase MsrA [Legionella pneumophila subsp. pneumophila LPE509]
MHQKHPPAKMAFSVFARQNVVLMSKRKYKRIRNIVSLFYELL